MDGSSRPPARPQRGPTADIPRRPHHCRYPTHGASFTCIWSKSSRRCRRRAYRSALSPSAMMLAQRGKPSTNEVRFGTGWSVEVHRVCSSDKAHPPPRPLPWCSRGPLLRAGWNRFLGATRILADHTRRTVPSSPASLGNPPRARTYMASPADVMALPEGLIGRGRRSRVGPGEGAPQHPAWGAATSCWPRVPREVGGMDNRL